MAEVEALVDVGVMYAVIICLSLVALLILLPGLFPN
jgi:hypothetical protein